MKAGPEFSPGAGFHFRIFATFEDQRQQQALLTHLAQCPADDAATLIAMAVGGARALRKALIVAVVVSGMTRIAVHGLIEVILLDEHFFAAAGNRCGNG